MLSSRESILSSQFGPASSPLMPSGCLQGTHSSSPERQRWSALGQPRYHSILAKDFTELVVSGWGCGVKLMKAPTTTQQLAAILVLKPMEKSAREPAATYHPHFYYLPQCITGSGHLQSYYLTIPISQQPDWDRGGRGTKCVRVCQTDSYILYLLLHHTH